MRSGVSAVLAAPSMAAEPRGRKHGENWPECVATDGVIGAQMTRVRDMSGALEFTKTVSESDVYLFAGITGDYSPVHIDAEYAARQAVGERVAHGILLLGLMSAAASQWARREQLDILSYGYDVVRFVKPVRFGDTITVAYAKDHQDGTGRKIFSRVDAHNQRGELVCVAQHILWIMTAGDAPATGAGQDAGRDG